MLISVSKDVFPLAQVFRISRGARTEAKVLTVSVQDNGVVGRGECVPYARYDETLESVTAEIEVLGDVEVDNKSLYDLLPAGAARNALDCALWDSRAKCADKRVWDLIPSLGAPGPVATAFTLSLDAPEKMEDQARENAFRPLLKTKLGGGEEDVARIEAVRRGAPEARIIVDANEGWTPDLYRALAPVLLRLGVEMVEQPLPASDDDMLSELDRVLPVCADESCHDRASLPSLRGKYDIVNIKIDKTGGLTEALALKMAALEEGYRVMVGCMVGSSLAMAPAMLVAQGVDYVDLDGPLLLAEDRAHPLRYDASVLHPPEAALWG